MSDPTPVLAGCRVLVTAQRRADELGAALVRRGAEVVHAPTLGVVARIDEARLVRRTADLVAVPPDVVVVTTGVGFRRWLETATAAGLRERLLETLGRTRLVARGPKAQHALLSVGLCADWVAEAETSRRSPTCSSARASAA